LIQLDTIKVILNELAVAFQTPHGVDKATSRYPLAVVHATTTLKTRPLGISAGLAFQLLYDEIVGV
jgi:hypothetical protein